ncbi:hypothetical protein [Bifidobacterium callitrichidarum]|uniref:Uncharacterized protein n=1 Tax=Bifidobacterium callitrichidarum TaxID=2052941 RepID=A0A2U2N9I3_9BIFI|nr:hypothetical protein [Bifidobacterium callitrichidarum]PWG65639.1 hypothetical protein DF196_06820 [Bifidobacterium callitrichidarum]
MTVSLEEAAFYEYFRWLLPDEQIIQCDHKQLNGKELDLWFPERHVAIEIGSWFVHQKSEDKDKKKRRLAKAKGIRLISVFTGRKDKDNGSDSIASKITRCPNNPDIIWVSYEISSGHLRREKFLAIVKTICENLNQEYQEPDSTIWSKISGNAAKTCDSRSDSDKNLANISKSSVKVLAQSMTDNWSLIFKQVSNIPAHEKNDYALKLINRVFPIALGIGQWPQKTMQRLISQAEKEYGQTVMFSSAEPAATYAVMCGLTRAYEQCKTQSRIVSLAVGALAESFSL